MRRLLGILTLGIFTWLAWHWTYSVSGWLLWGLLPALWLDRQLIRSLPWSGEARPLLGAILLRLGYGVAGTALVLPYYPRVPLQEGLVVGGALSMLAFGIELLLAMTYHRSESWFRLAALVPVLLLPLAILLPLRSFHQFHTRPQKSPANLGLPYEEVRIATADGVELAAWYVPHSQPRGGVLFLHGHGGNRQHVLWTLSTLHELGLTVVSIDFRGHGDSPGHTSTFGHREVADVIAAEAYLAERLPGLPIFLSGISYGGAVGLQALPQLPRVRAAWIDSAFARLTDVADNRFATLPTPIRDNLIHFYSLVLWCDCGFWGPDIRPIDCLQDIRVPIHFSHGTEDSLIPFRQAQEMYQAYGGPKQHFWMEGATHFKRSTEVSTEYLRRLQAFLAEQLQAR